MADILHAEWLRVRSTRGLALLLAATAVVTGLSTFSTTSATTPLPWDLVEPVHASLAWVLAAINGSFLALLAGARPFTDELRHGTLTLTVLADPGRTRTVLAKGLTAAGSGAVVGLVVTATVVGIRVMMATASRGELDLHAGDAGAAVGMVAAMALWGVIGAGVGATIRNPVAVAVGGLVWVLVIENLGAASLGTVGTYLPGQVSQALVRSRDAVELLSPGTAVVVMAVEALVVLLLALRAVRRLELR